MPSRRRGPTHKSKSILSAEGRARLRGWLESGPVLLAFDLDGTLVPLINDFTRVKLSPQTKDLLLQLKLSTPVAVVSGRSIRDLGQIVGSRRLKLVGNHGLEGLRKIRRPLHVKAWHRDLEKALRGQKGVQIEDKKISISVHYRKCPRRSTVKKIMFQTIPHLPGPLRVIMGKLVFNLIPDFGENKGWAVRQLQKKYRCKRALYVGDDITDEDVFTLHDKNILGIKVGRSTTSAAPYFLRGQREVPRLLAQIAGYLAESGKG